MELTNSTQDRLRILLAAGVPKRREGGVAAIIYNLGRELERRGHQVTYIFQEDLIDFKKVSSRFTELVFAIRLNRYILKNRGKFSIVNLHAPSGIAYGLRRRLWGGADLPPYVMTLHGLEERRVHVMSREVKKGRAWSFSWKNRLWHRWYHFPRFRWAIRTADGAHAYCREVWSTLQLQYNLDGDRVSYIPNGVEQRFFIRRDYTTKQCLRLLYAGTWLDQRGIFYIRDALGRLAPKIPGLRMTFAGGGVAAEEIISFLGTEIANKIEIHKVVTADRMQELYAQHDILLFPSLMEGLPSVLLEAMAAGMPVVTTETCGMPDVVENEFNGLLIPPADADAIEGAILRLAGSAELREKLGKAAQETMRRYTWERAALQLEALYRHVLRLESQKAE